MRKRERREPELMLSVEAIHESNGNVTPAHARLLADDPLVKANPRMFVPFAAGDRALWARERELSQEREAHYEAEARRGVEPIAPKPPPPAPVSPDDQVICIRRSGAVGASAAGVTVGEPLGVLVGEIVPRTLKVVKENRDNFIPVKPRELKPEAAMIALTDLESHNAHDGSPRKVYRGQWLDERDAMVALHPVHFERPLREPAGAAPADGWRTWKMPAVFGSVHPGVVSDSAAKS